MRRVDTGKQPAIDEDADSIDIDRTIVAVKERKGLEVGQLRPGLVDLNDVRPTLLKRPICRSVAAASYAPIDAVLNPLQILPVVVVTTASSAWKCDCPAGESRSTQRWMRPSVMSSPVSETTHVPAGAVVSRKQIALF